MTVASVRLDRLLANMGYGSRKDIHALAAAKRIVLAGAPLLDADARVTTDHALQRELKVAGRPLDPLPGFVCMMHKPCGVTCSHKEAGPLVYGLLPERWRHRKPAVSTVGRLDKETSGLLLLTDDGGFLHRVIAPKSQVTKRYVVGLARPLLGNEGDALLAGTLMLDGETTPLLPIEMEIIQAGVTPIVRVTLTEGRYHQVRRMFAALGNHVERLHRDRIGGLDLPTELEPGGVRILDDAQRAALFGCG